MSEDEALINRSEEVMKGLKFVYKTHYKMAEGYEIINRVLTIIVAAGTGILTAVIIWDAANRTVLLSIAAVVAAISWTDAILDLGVKSQSHFDAGDKYHTLYEDFQDYYHLHLINGAEQEETAEMFEELIKRKQNLKETTPRTTNFWFNQLDTNEIKGSYKRETSASR